LRKAPELEAQWQLGKRGEPYLAFLLAAHYATVATFVPTDVDTRIRQHTWTNIEGSALWRAIDRVEEVAAWNVRDVSARFVIVDGELVAGHHGEWLSVMAGALGRALVRDDSPAIERTSAWIDSELERQARIVAQAAKYGTDEQLLCAITTVAHNTGDLSRVVDTWRPEHAAGRFGQRYHRLGHERPERFGGVFVYAGSLNKRLMADENHRFLPLRTPKALRRQREWLLPFGPYLFEWGQQLGASPLLTEAERAEVLLALLNVHDRRVSERGCLRAIAGLHSSIHGGIDALRPWLPKNASTLMQRGGVRTALRTPESTFIQEFHKQIERTING